MDTYILTEKIEELQRFLDFVSERDKKLWDKYLKKYETDDKNWKRITMEKRTPSRNIIFFIKTM